MKCSSKIYMIRHPCTATGKTSLSGGRGAELIRKKRRVSVLFVSRQKKLTPLCAYLQVGFEAVRLSSKSLHRSSSLPFPQASPSLLLLVHQACNRSSGSVLARRSSGMSNPLVGPPSPPPAFVRLYKPQPARRHESHQVHAFSCVSCYGA